jgi:hypothetical protein
VGDGTFQIGDDAKVNANGVAYTAFVEYED